MEALSSFETSLLTRATRRNIPEDIILNLPLCFDEFSLHPMKGISPKAATEWEPYYLIRKVAGSNLSPRNDHPPS
jgi:hypothetical protein